jgi:polysaccharide deacetylase 2 family uncharacterized protein YibQ
MTNRLSEDASPLVTGIIHTGLSLFSLGMLTAGAGAWVHMTGDPEAAGPGVSIALFNPDASHQALPLKSRFSDREPVISLASATFAGPADGMPVSSFLTAAELAEGSGDSDPYDSMASAEATSPDGSAMIVRINGRAIAPGMSLTTSQGTDARTPSPLPRAPLAGLREKVGDLWLPAKAADGRLPARAYARPSQVSAATPRVALVVGGLGINHRTTLQAIADLPPEVTLSFSANTEGLQTLIDAARADGHEVLIEVPMEPYEWGRQPPQPNTLLTEGDAATNIDALNLTLARASGYFGIINYQGARFATNPEAVAPLMGTLEARGLAMIEDASLARSDFSAQAEAMGTLYARADIVIDAETQATLIEKELARLESEALSNGSALGTGFAFPVTVDTVLNWSQQLTEKGIALVPASALLQGSEPSGPSATRQAAWVAGTAGPAG